MKHALLLLLSLLISVSFFSCEKQDKEDLRVIDYFTYGKRFDFREVSIKTGSGDWAAMDKGHVFSLLGEASSLEDQLSIPRGSATYNDRTNLKTDFVYSILKDSVFPYAIQSDSIYFFDESMENFRSDLKGELLFSPDTAIILHNTGTSPTISIKYILERK